MENLLLATGLVKDYHKNIVSPRCAMKTDISKAFDSVQWDFVLNTLSALHFPETFIHWIRLCISTASFFVQVNGELAGFFESERGLRQDVLCLLIYFSYVWMCCREWLKKQELIGKLDFIQIIYIQITHICFVGDLMVFINGKRISIENTIKIFDEFVGMSGLKISLERSTLYLAGISENNRLAITSQFPFAEGQLPVRYLGLPLLTKRITSDDYEPLIEKILSLLSSWTARYLSYTGRLQLLQSVITSIANFLISIFHLPNDCIKKIEILCVAFLWYVPDLNPMKANVACREVCRPNLEGGLGLSL